jgi:esterase
LKIIYSKINHRLDSDNPTAPWIILIHGLFGNLDNLAMLRRELQSTFQVLSIDLPDHGKSSFSEKFSFSGYAEAIKELIIELGIENAALIGHSLGGKVAMQLALTYPQRVTNLVILDIAPVAYNPRHSNVFAALEAVDLNVICERKDAEKAMSVYIEEGGIRQFLLKSLYQQDGKWKWRFNLSLLHRDYGLLSQAIHSHIPYLDPVLFLKGELSDYLTSEYRNQVLSLFPNSRMKTISNSGHWLHAEQPKICARHIRTFLLN